jgi:hypothetical protein
LRLLIALFFISNYYFNITFPFLRYFVPRIFHTDFSMKHGSERRRFDPLPFIKPQRSGPTIGGALLLVVLVVFVLAGCSDKEEKKEQGRAETQESQLTPTQEASERQPPSPGLSKTTGEAERQDSTKGAGDEPGPQSGVTREEAQEELTKAGNAVENVQQLLQEAPRGKGSALALSALQQDVESARDRLQIAQNHFADQEFRIAHAQAKEARENANAIAQHLSQAINSAKRQSP